MRLAPRSNAHSQRRDLNSAGSSSCWDHVLSLIVLAVNRLQLLARFLIQQWEQTSFRSIRDDLQRRPPHGCLQRAAILENCKQMHCNVLTLTLEVGSRIPHARTPDGRRVESFVTGDARGHEEIAGTQLTRSQQKPPEGKLHGEQRQFGYDKRTVW